MGSSGFEKSTNNQRNQVWQSIDGHMKSRRDLHLKKKFLQLFFLIDNQSNIINENSMEKIQVVHDDEQQETKKKKKNPTTRPIITQRERNSQ